MSIQAYYLDKMAVVMGKVLLMMKVGEQLQMVGQELTMDHLVE